MEIPDKSDNNCFTYVIPDSREGWVNSLMLLMESYLVKPCKYGLLLVDKTAEPDSGIVAYENRGKWPLFDYSLLRPKNSKIKGFGGTASGPGPLIELHEKVPLMLDTFLMYHKNSEDKKPILDLIKNLKNYNSDEILSKYEANPELTKRMSYGKARLIVDLFNLVATVVISGNVRRCLPKGSLVHTRKAMIPIEEIEVGTEVLTSSGYKKVSNTFVQGKQKLVRINTQDGELVCTPES